MNKYIYLLVGNSGSGKTTVANILKDEYGWVVLDSYTTRKPRYDGETGHTFVTKEDFDRLENKVAATYFDENWYCATQDQVDNSDVYVIDPDGVDYFINHYGGNKIPIVVILKTSEENQIKNMTKRGDNSDDIWRRFENDRVKFKDFEQRMMQTNLHNICYDSNSIPASVIARMINDNREWRFEHHV